jgi:hypothetical protein
MKRLLALACLLFVTALLTVAVAKAEPIVVLNTLYNRNSAEAVCNATDAVAGCKALVQVTANRLDDEVAGKFAVNTRCKGIRILRNDDGKTKGDWDLRIHYYAYSKVHEWFLFYEPQPAKMIKGEGTPAQIADEVCIVVTGQGANIP